MPYFSDPGDDDDDSNDDDDYDSDGDDDDDDDDSNDDGDDDSADDDSKNMKSQGHIFGLSVIGERRTQIWRCDGDHHYQFDH